MPLMESLPNWAIALILSTIAGATIPLGAVFARIEHISPHWLEKEFRHFIIAFGGGVLLAAVSLVLIPEGIEKLDPFIAIAVFLSGGIGFYVIDRLIQQHGGHYSQLIAMLADFVPEAMALGALLSQKSDAALLLASLIALQNLPEGFNAYREIVDCSTKKPRNVMRWFFGLVITGPLCALLGEEVLSGYDSVLGAVMLFSSGGILYILFQDIAPQAHLKRKWAPPLGAVSGFALGLLGHLLLH